MEWKITKSSYPPTARRWTRPCVCSMNRRMQGVLLDMYEALVPHETQEAIRTRLDKEEAEARAAEEAARLGEHTEVFMPAEALDGNALAMHDLGKLRLEADDPAAARRWFQQSADLGNQFTQYRLGKLLPPSSPAPPGSSTTWAASSRSRPRPPAAGSPLWTAS